MAELIGIETDSGGLTLEVDLGYICNYKCSYCPPLLHSGKEWINFNSLIKFIDKVKPLRIVFPGGEPTLYPKIVKLLQYLKTIGVITYLVSNGTKSIEWWEKYNDLIDLPTFSFHIENADVESFIEKIKVVTKKRFTTVNVPMKPDSFNEIFKVIRRIRRECPDTYVVPKILTDNTTGLTVKYTSEQRSLMEKILFPEVVRFINPHVITTYKVYSDGKYVKTKPQELLAKGEIVYTGWKCWKGLQFLKVTPLGDVYLATCEVEQKRTNPIGSIYDLENIKWTTEPQICMKRQCNCITALRGVKKRKV
jgi:organic radical activating enzyme